MLMVHRHHHRHHHHSNAYPWVLFDMAHVVIPLLLVSVKDELFTFGESEGGLMIVAGILRWVIMLPLSGKLGRADKKNVLKPTKV